MADIKNISEWEKNQNFPLFENTYNAATNSNYLRYKGGSGYERLVYPIQVANGVKITFKADFCSPSGFTCSYGDSVDYIAIISGSTQGALNWLNVKAKTPIKSEATETPTHYEVSATATSAETWFLVLDFGYMTDGVETILSYSNIEYTAEYMWKIIDGEIIFSGAPPIQPAPIVKTYPAAFWRIDPVFNDGEPFNKLMPGIRERNLWIQPSRPLIHVYGTQTAKEEDFNTNGFAILEPISAEVYQEENGEYSATFETYCDKYNKFTYLKEQAHVKIPIKYHGRRRDQVFRISKTTRIMNDDGTYRIKAYAPHLFYSNNRFLIRSSHPTQKTGAEALPYIIGHSIYNDEQYPFFYSSDINTRATAYFDDMSITAALLGADQAFTNRWGGKLYRDNFYFSINKETENHQDAGVIVYGYNMQAIEFEKDDSEIITNLIAKDNFGNQVTLSVPADKLTVAERIYSAVKFSYDEEDKAALRRDAEAYLDNYKQSKVNIRINFLNLSDINLYKDFLSLDAYEVGDKVTVYHRDLDIYYSNLEIISKRYDVVSQKTTEIIIGDFKNAINRSAYMAGTATSGTSARDKDIIAVSDATDLLVISQSIEAAELFPISKLERYTINQIEGGPTR